jgi:hypothetical protein
MKSKVSSEEPTGELNHTEQVGLSQAAQLLAFSRYLLLVYRRLRRIRILGPAFASPEPKANRKELVNYFSAANSRLASWKGMKSESAFFQISSSCW